MVKRTPKLDRTEALSAVATAVRDALDTAKRFFWCNTNRDGAQAQTMALENQMHARGFAAAWIPFAYPAHMDRVRQGHVIVMYTNRVGVIAIGRAKTGVKVLGSHHHDRVRAFEYGQHEEEWRVPVDWCVWNKQKPCIMRPLRTSFLEITSHDELLKKIRNHYVKLS